MQLLAMHVQAQEVELELEKLFGKAAHLCQSESRNLAYVSEQHKQVPGAIRKLQETLSQTAGVADELSNRVRKLDSVCGRVSEALKIVDDMLDLRECSDHVMKAIQAKDYEQATKYVARFRASQNALPPGTDDTSVRVLQEAEKELGTALRKQFEDAMAANDSENVSRFAKLFHPLGLADYGVRKYVQFIRQSLADTCAQQFRLLGPSFVKRPDAEPNPYAECLLSVFTGIADICGKHQQEVEQEFGLENFIVVLRGLLEESDTQGLRVIEKFFEDHKKVFDQNGPLDTNVVGAVLAEAALLTRHTHMFDVYVRNIATEVVSLITDKTDFLKNLPAGYNETDGLAELTGLTRRIQELMFKHVLRVEQNFLEQSVKRALTENDSLDADDPDIQTTTLVDEALYVLLECVHRAVDSGDINFVCTVVNFVNQAIEGEMKDALDMNLKESKRLYGAWVSHFSNLAPPAKGEHPLASLFVDQEGRQRPNLTASHSWPHALNNLQQCIEYIDTLKGKSEEAFEEGFPGETYKDQRAKFQSCIAELDSTKADFEKLHNEACKQGLQMLKVHLSKSIEPIDALNYQISEAQYSDYQVNDPFAKGFITQASIIHQHLKSVLNSASCDDIMAHMAEQTCRRIENTALKKRFSLFGALQFDTDVRALCSFFTNVSEQALRHKFARLLEMSTLLNLENATELRELDSEMKTWRITPEEMRKLLGSRVDFGATEMELDLLLPH